MKIQMNDEEQTETETESVKTVSESDLHTKYEEFINFEKQKKAEINSKKLELLRSIAKEKVKVESIEKEKESTKRKIEQTQLNIEELRELEEEYTKRGVDLLKERNKHQEGNW
jgi:hypothetical protein